MTQIVTATKVRVEFIGSPKETSFQSGDFYQTVRFTNLDLPEGSPKACIWKALNVSECKKLVKGAIVYLVPAGKTPNGKPRHNIVFDFK